MLERALQHKSLRLPVLLGDGDELLVEPGVYFWSDLYGARGHGLL
jgi:hypothetical protein